MIEFHCPNCGQRLAAPETDRGRRGRCVYCGRRFNLPMSTGEVSQTSSPLEPMASPAEEWVKLRTRAIAARFLCGLGIVPLIWGMLVLQFAHAAVAGAAWTALGLAWLLSATFLIRWRRA
jgi:DNA-directed RNA polymerase subunit RPC12/RpoP